MTEGESFRPFRIVTERYINEWAAGRVASRNSPPKIDRAVRKLAVVPRRGLEAIFTSSSISNRCDGCQDPRGTYMGHRSSPAGDNAPPDADLAWLVNHWNHLPSEVKMTIMTVAHNVLTRDG